MNSLNRIYQRIRRSPLAHRLSSGFFWSTVSSSVAKTSSVVATLIIARLIGKTSVGELGIIQGTVGIFATVAGFGLDTTGMKYVAEFRETDKLKVGRIISLIELSSLLLGIAFLVIFNAMASWLCNTVLNAPHLVAPLRIGSTLLLAGALTMAYTGIIAGFERFSVITKLNVIFGVVNIISVFALTSLYGFTGAIVGMSAAALLNIFLQRYGLQKLLNLHGINFRYKDCLKEISLLWNFSFPAVLGALLVVVVQWFVSVLLINTINGYDEMGIYNVANQWKLLILFVPQAIANVVLPALSNLKGSEQIHTYMKVVKYNIGFNALLTAILALIVIVSSKLILSFYGQDFIDSYLVLIVLSMVAVAAATINVIGHVIASLGKMWSGFILNAVWGIAFIGSSYIFLYKGALGIAYAQAISYFVHLIIVSIYTYFLIKTMVRA